MSTRIEHQVKKNILKSTPVMILQRKLKVRNKINSKIIFIFIPSLKEERIISWPGFVSSICIFLFDKREKISMKEKSKERVKKKYIKKKKKDR